MKKALAAALAIALVVPAFVVHAENGVPMRTELSPDLTPPPSASLSASASASGSSSAAPAITNAPKDVFAAGEKTPLPKIADWKGAEAVTIEGSDVRCKAVHVHEWLRIRCNSSGIENVSLLAGTRDNTFLGITAANTDMFLPDTTADIILPVRVGDRREIQVLGAVGGGYGGMLSPEAEVIVTEYWLASDEPPVIVIRSA